MTLSGATYFLGVGSMSSWFPTEASYTTIGLDNAFYGIYVAAIFAVVLVVGLAATFVTQFRRQHDSDRGAAAGPANPLLLGLWVLCALGLGVFAFTADFCGFVDSTVAPKDAMQIDVTASMWNFKFQYPNGHITDTLYVAKGRPVQLNLNSLDVVHSLTIPALRINQAILPGQTTTAWFEAGIRDTFVLRSNIYSGAGYTRMKTALITQTPAVFDNWLSAAVDIFIGKSMAEVGEILYTRHGCKACHSLDGSKLVGPSFKDLYGNTFETKEGTPIVTDAAYVKESILTPLASVIAGYEPVMPPYEGKISDKEIEAITEWLKTMSSFAGTLQEGK